MTMSQTYSPPGPATSRVPILLLAAWGLMTLAAVALVFTCAPNAPAEEEWGFVGVLLEKEPVGPWIWAQHDLDRLPLARLLYYAEFRLTRDFRACMLLQIAMVSALCLGLMRLAANLRGRPDWADLFFPISLLHVGHWENYLLGYQIRFVLFLVLASGLIAIGLRTRRETAFRSGVLGGAMLIVVALTGKAGLVLVLPVAAWLIYLATIIGRSEGRTKAAIVGSLAIASVIYFALGLIGYGMSERDLSLISNPITVITRTGQALAMALGAGVSGVWWAIAVAEVILVAATITWLVRRGRNRDHRLSSVGLIAVALGVVAVAMGIGLNGSGNHLGLRSRYSFLMWPLLGAAYLFWVQAGRKWIPIGLCIASALAFPLNTGLGMARVAVIVSAKLGFEIDLHAGIPDDILIRTHFPSTRNDGQQERARWAIPLLREARIGPFAPAGEDTSRLWWVAVEVLAAAVVTRWLWNLGKAVQSERARELFRLQHERFEEQLLAAASATGLPRGLRWVSCSITEDAVLVRDATDASIVALVPVTLQFEPIEGSEMEQVPAAREPRPATAVFTFARGVWQTAGRVVFNHTPEQTVAKFAPRYRVIEHGHH